MLHAGATRRLFIHHGVGIFHTQALVSAVFLDDCHHIIVSAFACPVALQYEHDLQGCHRDSASLLNATHRSVMRDDTVKIHMTHVFEKLRVQRRTEAIAAAVRR